MSRLNRLFVRSFVIFVPSQVCSLNCDLCTHVIPLQAIKKYGTHTRLDDEAHPASHSAVWHNIHTIVYKAYECTDRVRSSGA